MGEVAVTLNHRTYLLACGEGEEARLAALVAYVRTRVETLAGDHGRVGDDRLLLMAALLIADELFELRESLGETVAGDDTGKPAKPERKAARKPSAA